MTTGLEAKYDIVNEWNFWFDPQLRRLVMPLVTTHTAADKLKVIDTALARGTHAVDDYNRLYVEIVQLVTGGPAVGEIAVVDDAGFTDASGTLAVSPAFTDEVQAATKYVLYEAELSPDRVSNEINRVLRATEAPHLWFPSMVHDAAIETTAALLATDWPDVVAPGTTATNLVTASANLMFGTQSINGVADDADQGWQSQAFNVHETDTLLVCVFVRAAVGSLDVQLYDVTNTTVVKEVTIDEQAWTEVRFAEPVPDDCEQMRIRILSNASADDMYMGGPVVVQSTAGHDYTCPSWFTSTKKFVEVLELPAGFVSEDADSYGVLTKGMVHGVPVSFLQSARDVNPLVVQFRARGNPVALSAYRAFAEITVNTGTTPCDRIYLMHRVMANLLRANGNARYKEELSMARDRARGLRYGLRAIKLQESPAVLV